MGSGRCTNVRQTKTNTLKCKVGFGEGVVAVGVKVVDAAGPRSPLAQREKTLFFAFPFSISNTPSHSLSLPLRFASGQERPRELAAIREGRWGQNKAMGCCKFCADKKICRGPPPPSPCPIVTARMCALPLLQMRCKKIIVLPIFECGGNCAKKRK